MLAATLAWQFCRTVMLRKTTYFISHRKILMWANAFSVETLAFNVISSNSHYSPLPLPLYCAHIKTPSIFWKKKLDMHVRFLAAQPTFSKCEMPSAALSTSAHTHTGTHAHTVDLEHCTALCYRTLEEIPRRSAGSKSNAIWHIPCTYSVPRHEGKPTSFATTEWQNRLRQRYGPEVDWIWDERWVQRFDPSKHRSQNAQKYCQ